jgi:hypothetical protein
VPTSWLKRLKARLRRPAAAHPEPFDATKFSVDDFRVSGNELRECINLIAVAESDKVAP